MSDTNPNPGPTPGPTPDIEAIFHHARTLPAAERGAYVAAACAGHAAVRAAIEQLLAAVENAGGFLASQGPARAEESAASAGSAPAPTAGFTTATGRITERPGVVIGPYKLLQLIGEGGFGTVFLAEQTAPVRRRVALKIIKLGMDTRQVVARFEAERQALAMMDHPHIARVLDGGATESGRPYFVMEYVVGDAITTFADAHALNIAQRLDLFGQVCSAVQHAHTKGIIHRDLKPGNVLVSMVDDKPFAKVIDFGIAKATGGGAGHLTDKTLFTEHRQLIGTPEYMSPEQAEGSQDIDTRTDVYALGVLLYELLTGSTPIESARLRSAAYGEMQRIIREEEPLAPSMKLSRSLEKLAGTAAARRAEPGKLSALVRGELDWIVLKALEKERARRYETASALAEDVKRHLAGEPVVAAPVSRAYRVRKFVRRNRGAVGAISAVMVALAAGGSVAAWQWSAALRANARLVDTLDFARTRALALAAQQTPHPAHGEGQTRRKVDGQVIGFQYTTDGDGTRYTPLDGQDEVHLTKALIYDIFISAFENHLELQEQVDAAEWSAYTANLALAQAAMEAGNYPEARKRLADAPESKRGWEWKLLWRRASAVDVAIAHHFAGLVFSEDGSRVSPTEPVGDFSAASGARLSPELLGRRYVRHARISASGEVEVFQPSDEQLRWQQDSSVRFLVERLTGEQVSRIDFVSFDRLGSKLIWRSGGIGWPDTPIHRVVSVDQWGGPERDLAMPLSFVASHQINTRPAPDSLIALRRSAILDSSPNGPSGLTLTTPDGTRRIVGGADKTTRFYEAKDGKPTLPATAEHPEGVYREVAVFRMPDAVTNLQMTGDGARLVIHLEGGSARVWDIRDPEERRKDLQAEWAERVPAGAYLDTLWAGDTADDKLQEAVINDASLTPLRRLVAADMLEERLGDDRIAAERALEQMKQAAVPDGATGSTPAADPALITNAVRAAAAAAELPKRVKARVVALAAGWEYKRPEPTAEQKLAEQNRQRRLAEAMNAVLEHEGLDLAIPTKDQVRRTQEALATFEEILGPRSLEACRARVQVMSGREGVTQEALLRARAELGLRNGDLFATFQNLWLIASSSGSGKSLTHPTDYAIQAMARWRAVHPNNEDRIERVNRWDVNPDGFTSGRVLTADEHRQLAREALAKARALMAPAADGTPSPWANDQDAKALLAEAAALIEGAGAAQPATPAKEDK